MIPTIGLIISMYVITRYVSFIQKGEQFWLSLIFLILTAFMALGLVASGVPTK